jgi:excisionase family DNA binding protein
MAVPGKITSPVMKVEEVCKLLRLHRSSLYRLVKARAILGFRLGSDCRFNREKIEQWLQLNERKSTR